MANCYEVSNSGSDGKESACKAGDPGSIPGLRRSPGEGNDNPLQYSCLGNSMDRGAWWGTVHRVTKSRTQPKQHTHTPIHTTYTPEVLSKRHQSFTQFLKLCSCILLSKSRFFFIITIFGIYHPDNKGRKTSAQKTFL